MNTLTMGPLTAKVKDERSKWGQDIRVFRCGVRDCSEKLGFVSFHGEGEARIQGRAFGPLQLEAGYFFAKAQGCFVKTKRPANRLPSHREFARDVTGYHYDERWQEIQGEREDRLRAALEDADPFADNVNTVCSVDTSDLDKEERTIQSACAGLKRTRKHVEGIVADCEEGPFLFKCGRCGQLSKITL